MVTAATASIKRGCVHCNKPAHLCLCGPSAVHIDVDLRSERGRLTLDMLHRQMSQETYNAIIQSEAARNIAESIRAEQLRGLILDPRVVLPK